MPGKRVPICGSIENCGWLRGEKSRQMTGSEMLDPCGACVQVHAGVVVPGTSSILQV